MGSQKSTSKTTSEPWKPTQPALERLIPQVEQNQQDRLNQQFFPGQTYAGFDPLQSQALTGVENTANSQIAGNSLTKQATDYTSDVLGGQYTAADNPYWGAVAKSVGDPVQASLSAQFSKAGRGTSGDAARYVGQGMTAALAPFQYQTYEAERQRQEAAANRAPQLDQAAYDPFAALYGAGGARQAMDQQGIQEAMARYDFDQNKSANALMEAEHMLMGLGKMGGESTTTTKASMSPLQMIAGGAMTGLGLMGGSPFQSMSWLPWFNKPMGA